MIELTLCEARIATVPVPLKFTHALAMRVSSVTSFDSVRGAGMGALPEDGCAGCVRVKLAVSIDPR